MSVHHPVQELRGGIPAFDEVLTNAGNWDGLMVGNEWIIAYGENGDVIWNGEPACRAGIEKSHGVCFVVGEDSGRTNGLSEQHAQLGEVRCRPFFGNETECFGKTSESYLMDVAPSGGEPNGMRESTIAKVFARQLADLHMVGNDTRQSDPRVLNSKIDYGNTAELRSADKSDRRGVGPERGENSIIVVRWRQTAKSVVKRERPVVLLSEIEDAVDPQAAERRNHHKNLAFSSHCN